MPSQAPCHGSCLQFLPEQVRKSLSAFACRYVDANVALCRVVSRGFPLSRGGRARGPWDRFHAILGAGPYRQAQGPLTCYLPRPYDRAAIVVRLPRRSWSSWERPLLDPGQGTETPARRKRSRIRVGTVGWAPAAALQDTAPRDTAPRSRRFVTHSGEEMK